MQIFLIDYVAWFATEAPIFLTVAYHDEIVWSKPIDADHVSNSDQQPCQNKITRASTDREATTSLMCSNNVAFSWKYFFS